MLKMLMAAFGETKENVGKPDTELKDFKKLIWLTDKEEDVTGDFVIVKKPCDISKEPYVHVCSP